MAVSLLSVRLWRHESPPVSPLILGSDVAGEATREALLRRSFALLPRGPRPGTSLLLPFRGEPFGPYDQPASCLLTPDS
jgi:hypothetical protein